MVADVRETAQRAFPNPASISETWVAERRANRRNPKRPAAADKGYDAYS